MIASSLPRGAGSELVALGAFVETAVSAGTGSGGMGQFGSSSKLAADPTVCRSEGLDRAGST